MLLPHEYWKFFIDVSQWDKNDPLVFDKEDSPGYFRQCSMTLLWMIRTLSQPLDLDYIINLRNIAYHDNIQKKRGLALDNVSSGIGKKSFTKAGLEQLINDTNTVDGPAYYFIIDSGILPRKIRLWECYSNVDDILQSIQEDAEVSLCRGHPDQKEHDHSISFVTESFLTNLVSDVTDRANHYLDCYKKNIDQAKTIDEKLEVIVTLVKHLHQFHLFWDGNGRTFCFFLLNRLLIQENLTPTIVEDPSYFTGWSVEELVTQVKEGQQRFLSLCHPLEGNLIETIKAIIALTPEEEKLFFDLDHPQEWKAMQESFLVSLKEDNLAQKEILLRLPFHLRISLLKQLFYYNLTVTQREAIFHWLKHLLQLQSYGFDTNDDLFGLEKIEKLKGLMEILHSHHLGSSYKWQQFILSLQHHENKQHILEKAIEVFNKMKSELWVEESDYLDKLMASPNNYNLFNFDKYPLNVYKNRKWSLESIILIKTYISDVSTPKTFLHILDKIWNHQITNGIKKAHIDIKRELDDICMAASNGYRRNNIFSQNNSFDNAAIIESQLTSQPAVDLNLF